MNDMTTNSEALETMRLAAMSIKGLSEQMGLVSSKLNEHERRLEETESAIKTIRDNERINRSQGKQIKRAVIGRVNDLLKIRFEGGRVADDCVDIDRKYRGGFIARCYTDAKRAGLMAECYWETARADYDKCIEYIESWVPEVDGGTAKYKEYLDIRREERRKRG